MNCERNICYQQDYNGGCDTCPCNDESQECKEENGQSMTDQEIIEQLKSLKNHCEDFREDEECIWAKDVEALDKAIESLEKQATSDYASEWIPVSERLPENIKTVLVTLKEMEQPTIGWYGNIDGWRLSEKEFCCIDHEVIAWMPCPEPYKGESV